MKIKTSKEYSFGKMLDDAIPKEEIMHRCCINEKQFEKLKAEVGRIRKEQQEKKQGKKT